MNFDDNENEPRISIDSDDEQKLTPREQLDLGANDVLCGRGKISFNHVGNRRFRVIIADSIEDYNAAASRKAKSVVVKRVHDTIRATGGRFLRMNTAHRTWVELGNQRSLEKVSHAIRDATSTNENMKKRKEKVHSTIAEVAAQVSSRFPSVHLEHKLDDDDEQSERLAFKSIEGSLSMSSMPSLPIAMPLSAAAPAGNPISTAVAALHQEEQLRSDEIHMPQQQHDPQRHSPPEDDFLCFINEVLGPVSSDDISSDPLKKLDTRRIPPNQKRGNY